MWKQTVLMKYDVPLYFLYVCIWEEEEEGVRNVECFVVVCVALRRECFWSVCCRRFSVPLRGFFMSFLSPVVPACNRNGIGLRQLLVLTKGSICLHVSLTCFSIQYSPSHCKNSVDVQCKNSCSNICSFLYVCVCVFFFNLFVWGLMISYN